MRAVSAGASAVATGLAHLGINTYVSGIVEGV